ncbi:MAG: phosphate/phosphite/phosphonate ABC transporter substrate-binding protein [Thermodesulfovibrionales bacterium]
MGKITIRREILTRSLEMKVLATVAVILIAGVISAGFMAVSIQKTTLYSVTELATEKTAQIISQNVETTMLEGKADITKKIVGDMRKIGGIDDITVLNAAGREAFKEGSPEKDASALEELKSGKDRLLRRETSRIIFYMPLRNQPSCRTCHGTEAPLLGAVKTSISIEKEYKRAMALITMVILITVAASLCFSLLLWTMLRKMVIRPVKSMESAAARIAEGDLSFTIESGSADEIGRTGEFLNGAFLKLEGVLLRIKELSDRILAVVGDVERESEKVLKGAEAESAATHSISSSVLELNATAAEITENTEGLAASAGDASASIEQMVSSIKSINGSIQELKEIVESTTDSIEHLSTAIKAVAANSGELADASDETIAAISEITTTIKEVERNAKESAALSEKVTSDAANFGMASIAKTIDGMKDISSSVTETADCIRVLGNRSQEIEKILGVIETVNDETNLLSLNAAILAAEAGVHGKGFSVVAGEISALAERTEASTNEIAALIRAVQEEVANAADAMQKGIRSVEGGIGLARGTEEALRKVLNSSQKSSEMTLSIKRATAEQAKSALLVAEATERMRKMIEDVAEATAEQSKEVGLVAEAAEKMRKLSLLVSGATDEQATSSGQIAQATELVSERSRQISMSLAEHKKGSESILHSVEAMKDIPVQNRELAFRISKTLWNLQKDAELLQAEMERFRFSGKKGHSVRLGVVPLQEPSVMFRKFFPLSEYLGRRLGIKVDLKVAIDMDDAVKDIGQNATQLCAMGPANYVEANRRYGVMVIAKALRKGEAYHHAAVVVKSDSGIRSLDDLKGKSFAFGGVTSSTGFIMPLATLKDAGISLRDLRYYEFLDGHDEVAKAVVDGSFDAGGLMEEKAYAYRDRGIRILALSVPIPEFNMCCNGTVNDKMREDIRDALAALDVMKPDDATVLHSLGKDCSGFEAATEEEYELFKKKILAIEADVSTEQQSRIAKGLHRNR